MRAGVRLVVAFAIFGFSQATAPAANLAALADPPLPELTQPVHDFAGVVDPSSEQQLDQLSRSLQAASGDVLVVVTVPTIEPYADIREYAVKLFENHGRGIGEKGKDNGVLILLSEVERRVVILGDACIHAKIQAAGWQRHVDHIVQAIHAGRTEHGVCETLRAIGETLTAEFPRKADDVDELPNVVRRDPR